MNKEKITKYFARIGLDIDCNNIKPTVDLLNSIQYAHVTHIPYENLDILHNVPLNLDSDALFDKIVNRKRGGYCFELNCLYNWLLKELGYTTVSYFARYLRDEPAIPMRRHRIIAAHSDYTDGVYICDAGIGDRAPRHVLKLEENTVQSQFGEKYRFAKDNFFGWLLKDYHKGSWAPFYAFTTELQLDIDYVMPSYYCEKSPDSVFNKTNIISLKTNDGRKTIADKSFRIFKNNEVVETKIESDDMLREILQTHFGITS
jgi:N-hydroxyarylamine O-acetyltransferase